MIISIMADDSRNDPMKLMTAAGDGQETADVSVMMTMS